MKPIREDADECVRPPAQDDRLSQRSGIAMVAPHPERVADDGHRWRAGPIFSREETAPEGGLDAEHLEYPGTGARAADPFRLLAAGEREPRRIVRGEADVRRCAALEVEEVERRRQVVATDLDVARRDRYEAIRLRVWQRPEERCVNDAEHRQIDADAEREHRDDGGNACAAQAAHRVATVLPQLVEHALPAGGTQVFLQGLGAAELDAGAALRLGRRHAAPHQVLGVGIDVEPKLVGDAIFKPLPPKRCADRGPKRVEESHPTPPCR